MKEKVKVTLAEIVNCHRTHESIYDFLTERVEEKLGQALEYFQIVDYCIVGFSGEDIEVEVEGYEE